MTPVSNGSNIEEEILSQIKEVSLIQSGNVQQLTIERDGSRLKLSDLVPKNGYYSPESKELVIKGYSFSRLVHTLTIALEYQGIQISNQNLVLDYGKMKLFEKDLQMKFTQKEIIDLGFEVWMSENYVVQKGDDFQLTIDFSEQIHTKESFQV